MRRGPYFAWGFLKINCIDIIEVHFSYTRLIIIILAQNPTKFQRVIVLVIETITKLEYLDVLRNTDVQV
jgi:hypothetical protein